VERHILRDYFLGGQKAEPPCAVPHTIRKLARIGGLYKELNDIYKNI
jgi:hypothetical protein